MTIQFLLDTNIISEPLRAIPNSNIMRHLECHEKQLAIPAIVWHELLVGCMKLPHSKKRQAIEQYVNEISVPVLPYDEKAALWHAVERTRLIKLGKTPPFIDGQIAAIAATQNLTLVTFNTSDFLLFENLRLTDWQKK